MGNLVSSKLARSLLKLVLFCLILSSIVFIYRVKRNDTPYFYLGIEFLLISAVAAVRTQRPYLKSFYITVAMITLVFTISEAYFSGWLFAKPALAGLHKYKYEGTYVTNNRNYWRANDLLGYAGGENIRVTSKRSHDEKVIYDVVYTNNRFGLRIAPHDVEGYRAPIDNNYQNLVFFGCSFMVGQGVNDNETLPYLVEKLSGGHYRSYNFGFHGYGPHQMLRIIETGLLDKVVTDKKPSLAVCEILTDHVERSAGNYPYIVWDDRGPEYRLNPSGQVEYVGKFRDGLFFQVKHQLNSLMAKSFTLEQTTLRQRLTAWDRTPQDVDLFLQIIKKAQEIFAEKYHGRFIILFWKLPYDRDYDLILSKLRQNGLEVVTSEEIFHVKDPTKLYLIPDDGHPNPMANQKVAEYFLAKLGNPAVAKMQ